MMVVKLGVILQRTELAFESKGVLNPAVMQEGNTVHMFYRAFKEGNYSTIGYCRFEGPSKLVCRGKAPVFYPDPGIREECQGVEDARMVKIGDTYYLTYTAYDGHNALGAVATTTDLANFKRVGIITPKVSFRDYFYAVSQNKRLNTKYLQQYQFLSEHGMLDKVINYLIWDKNLLLFPEKINGQYVLLHRLFPGIQIVRFNDFSELTADFWLRYLYDLDRYIVMDPAFWYETSHIGGGCPPIRTEQGWLLIYHAVEVTPHTNVYHVSAALLDLDDPQQVIARLQSPLISPEEEWERAGYVNNVCFPTGTAVFGKDLHIYYGAADSSIAVAHMNIDELVNELLQNKWDHKISSNA